MAWSGGNNAAPQGGLMGDQSAPLIHSWNSLQPTLLLVNTSFPFTWKHAAIVYIFTPLHLPTLPYRSLLTVNPVPPAQPWPHSNSTVILNALLKSCQRRFHLVKSYAKLNSTLNSMLFSHSFVQLFDSMDWSMPGLPVPHQLPELCSNSCPSSRWCHPTISFCHPFLLPPSIFPSIRVFSNESALHSRWPKYWSFSFSISPSSEYSGLISFRMDWLDLFAVQGLSRVFSNTTVQKHQFFSAHYLQILVFL